MLCSMPFVVEALREGGKAPVISGAEKGHSLMTQLKHFCETRSNTNLRLPPPQIQGLYYYNGLSYPEGGPTERFVCMNLGDWDAATRTLTLNVSALLLTEVDKTMYPDNEYGVVTFDEDFRTGMFSVPMQTP